MDKMRIGVIYNLVDTVTTGLEQDAVSDNEVVDTLEHVISALEPEHEAIPLRVRRDNLSLLTRENFDFVFNLAEGLGRNPFGEPWIASYLELQDLRYTGSDPVALALCLDKAKAKGILRDHNLPTPKYKVLKSKEEKVEGLEFPLIVKPVHEDASIGITQDSVVSDRETLERQVDFVLTTYNQDALVEEFIDGREVNVSVIGNKNPAVLPICELEFNFGSDMQRIASFDTKWVDGSKQHDLTTRKCPANLSSSLESKVRRLAIEAFKALGCRDYARVDFRIRNKQGRRDYSQLLQEPLILEVNPNPGINSDTSFFKSALTLGLDYKKMIQAILRQAMTRYPRQEENKRFSYNNGGFKLVQVRKQDVPTLVRWFNDRELCKFMADPEETYTDEKVTEDILLDTERLCVVASLDEEKIGYGSIYDEDEGEAQVSIFISREYQGRGYGKRLLRNLVDIGFNQRGLNRLLATVTTANTASLATLKSVGFSIIGRRKDYHRFEGRLYDEKILELVKP